MDDPKHRAGRAVPRGRLSRLAALGGLATGVATGMAAEGVRRLAGGERPSLRSMLLTPANARRVADQLAEMRGAAMKLGQLLSMEAGDMLPPELAEILSRLRAEARPMPARQLKATLEDAWGVGFLRRFERFDVTPIAAASIGQVHRAVARDGRALAVKVQYPGVRRSIDSDVDNVAALIRMTRLAPPGVDLAPLLAEAKRQLHEEADYRREAANLARFHALLTRDESFLTPAPHADLTTETTLAMDFLDGDPIESLETSDQETRDRVVAALLRLALRELFEFRLMQTDPNFANFQVTRDRRAVILLDFGATRPITLETAERFRALGKTALEGDDAGLRDAALALGLFKAGGAAEAAMLDMMILARDALLAAPVFDFGSTTLLGALRDRGAALALDGAIDHAPPPEVLFIQRKLAGLFLLATRLQAKAAPRTIVAGML